MDLLLSSQWSAGLNAADRYARRFLILRKKGNAKHRGALADEWDVCGYVEVLRRMFGSCCCVFAYWDFSMIHT